ncbi:hypothetical protein N7462_001430 [Penicillium macrosclerotiorum]|uniref:uncharacterized protein n=1 Tax=Penicillium macrosclerotiorum TaxID=303699 RepID=UPI0025492017|nr:uncharacterized protein N7462_001430 [Penicillium macrosclerotiorum]KAJ5692007.1 hypothetical protein N7462_001430 [Penicillium macrosclerotiorum]
MFPAQIPMPPPDRPVNGFPKHLAEEFKAAVIDATTASTVTALEVVAALIKNGGYLVRRILNTDQLALIEKDVRPSIEKDRPRIGDFFPPETRRVMGLVEKSKVFTDLIPGNRLYQHVCGTLLISTQDSWLGQILETSDSHRQLNNTIFFSIGPSARRQELHRDDMLFHNGLTEHTSHEDYKIGRDTNIRFFVAGKKTTKANEATRFIPRRHFWSAKTPPNEDLTYYGGLLVVSTEAVQTPALTRSNLFSPVS